MTPLGRMGSVLALTLALPVLFVVVVTPLDARPQAIFAATVFAAALVINRARGPLVTQLLTLLSAVVSARYMFFRLSSTLGFESTLDAAFGWLLMAAEIYTYVVLLLGHFQTTLILPRKPTPLPADRSLWPTVDVFVPSYNESLDVVRPTVLAALAIDWPREKLRVYLLDDGKRAAFRDFAAAAGVGYLIRPDNKHAKAGNINAALKHTHGDLIAIFDADHIAARSFLQMTAGWFLRDEKLSLVQTPHHFYNPDPIERNSRTYRDVPNEGELFYGMVQAGNDFWNATFFCGSCAVLRRSALESVGGVATESLTEDALTSLKMQRRGYNAAYIGVRQSGGLATDTLAAHVGQRIRWAQGMVQILRVDNPLLGPGLRLGQRLCFLNAILHFLYGLPRIVFLCAPLAYLILGVHICATAPLLLLSYVGPHLLHAVLVDARTKGRFRYSFWAAVYEVVLATHIVVPTMAALLRPKAGVFKVTAKGERVSEGLDRLMARPYVVLLIAEIAGVCFALARLLLWDYYDAPTVAMNLGWTLFNIPIIGAALGVALEMRQRRGQHRIDVRLRAMLETPSGHTRTAETRNISLGGCALELGASCDVGEGDAVQVTLFVDDKAHALPATVLARRDRSLRLAFTSLSLRQESRLVQTMFGRPDAWLHWDAKRGPDRPLRSFGIILKDSASAVGKVLATWPLLSGGVALSGAAAFAFLLLHTDGQLRPVMDRITGLFFIALDGISSAARTTAG